LRAEDQEDRIGRLLTGCDAYWAENGVPRERADEMLAELGQHLDEAARDGKTVEDVVGADLERFAEEWAAPNRPSKPLWEETLDVISDALVGLAVLAALAHLYYRSPTLPADWKAVLGAAVFALVFVRLFAYLRAPSEAPPGSDERVLDRYPRRLYGAFMWFLVAVWAAYLLLPLPDGVLFDWPWQATLALPVGAVLLRVAKRLAPERTSMRPAPRERREDGPRTDDPEGEILEAVLDCRWQWSAKGVPEGEIEEMSEELEQHLREATRDGRPVSAVVGPDVSAFARRRAEESGATVDPSPETLKDRLLGWVLSFSACATVLAAFFHVLEWTLYVPVAWVAGMYLLLLTMWFLGDPIERLLVVARRWQRTPWKSMLAAGALTMALVAVSSVFAFFFMVVGPRLPFQWPWYATIASALIAFLVVLNWVRESKP
jgi:DNA-binding ferritin-like protein (Dps family)